MHDADRFETLAIHAVTYLLSDARTRDGFLGSTGLEESAIRAGLENISFLAGVLEYLLNREDLLLEFCKQYDYPPEMPAKALHALSQS
jgi:hypothetical protein